MMSRSTRTLSRPIDADPASPPERATRIRTLAAAVAITAGCAVLFASQSPDAALRGDLAAAAGVVGALPTTASAEDVDAALAGPLRGRVFTVDAAGFPSLVAITFHGLDRQSCAVARAKARRLEGKVVVELEGYGAPADCGVRNDMTWRLMP